MMKFLTALFVVLVFVGLSAKAAQPLNAEETLAAASFQGFFDSADCNTIFGWAWDSTQPNTSITVDVYDGSTFLTTLQANQFRSDLPGNKNHAFNFTTPSSLKNGVAHSIHIKFGGTSTELTNSPRSLTCAPAPHINSISPNPVPGKSTDQTVSIFGTGFVSGSGLKVHVTSSSVNTDLTGSQVSWISSSQINILITVGTSADNWTATVINPDGQSSNAAPFSVTAAAAAPHINSISPNPVPGKSTDQTVTIFGTGFVSGSGLKVHVTSSSVNTDLTGTQVSWISSSQINILITVGTSADNWTATVINPDGQSSNGAPFSVTATASAPHINSISPNPVPGKSTDQTVSIFGTGFVSGSGLKVHVTSSSVNTDLTGAQVSWISSSQINILITVGTSADNWTATVINPDGQSSNAAPFSVTAAAAAPHINSISPNPVPGKSTDQTVTIFGTGFVSGSGLKVHVTSSSVNTDLTGTQVSWISATQINILITVGTSADNWTATVINPDGQSSNAAPFSVTAAAAAPTISGYSWNPTTPSSNQFFGGSISGTGFVAGIRVFFCVTGTNTCFEHPAAGITLNSSTSLSLNNVNLSAGSWQFYVQTSVASSRSTSFTVQTTAAPTVSTISPGTPAASGSDQNVTVTGSNFQQNLTVAVVFPSGGTGTLSGTQIQNVTPTSFTMRITLGAAGPWSMRVNNPDGSQSGAFGFTVQSNITQPTISSINPSNPFVGSSDQDVTVFGSDFQPNLAVSATFPNGGSTTLNGAQIQNVTASSFVLRITLGTAGPWSIKVNNTNGGQSSPFNFNVSSGSQNPSISSINPTIPSTNGADQNVTVNGSNFQQGLRVDVSFPNGGVSTLQGTGQIQNVAANSFLMRITLNAAGPWTIRVVNPDGSQSGQFNFNVQASGPTPSGLPGSVLSPVIGALRVTTSNLGISDGKWEFDQHKTGNHTPTGGISLSNDTFAWDTNLYDPTNGNADAGKAVYATADGVVVSYVGTPPGGGPGAVLIAHPNATNPIWFSGYLHMTNVRVSLNQAVTTTTVLGEIGRVGADNDHLHFVVYSGADTRGNLQSFNPTITERLSNANNAPTIGSVEPNMVNQSINAQLITINGSNFQADSIIEAKDPNGHAFTVTGDSIPGNVGQITNITATAITAQVPFAFGGNYEFAVVNRSSVSTQTSGAITGSAANTTFAMSSSCSTCTVYSAPNGRSPVVLIPGIMGSRIAKRNGSSFEELFPSIPYFDSEHTQLKNFVGFGSPIDQRPVVATDILREYIDISGSRNYYGTLIDSMTGAYHGYRLYQVNNPNQRTLSQCDTTQKDANLFIFPYDWRSGIEQSAKDLKDYVDCIKKIYDPGNANPNFKVNIIAHSMGGLVARRYILEGLYGTSLNYDPKVDKLVTIGTPWLGAPKFILALETGEVDGISTGFPKLMHQDVVKDVVRYMPGAHELIPSRIYTNELRDTNLGDFPFGENGWDFDGNKRIDRIYNFAALETIMNRQTPDDIILPGTNTDLFHNKTYLNKPLQDNWTGDQTGVTYYNFVGRKQGANSTIGSIIATDEWYKDRLGRWQEKKYLDPKMTRGDGTVPEISSTRQSNNGNYLGPAISKVFENIADHGTFSNDPRVISTIDCLFAGADSKTCLNQPSAAQKPQMVTSAVDTPVYDLKILGSSMVLISDSFGNTTNPLSSSSDEGVATLSTTVTGTDSLDTQLPLDQTYKVIIRTSSSPLVLALTKSEGQLNTLAIRYADLPIPSGVLASLEITPQGVTTLKYDSDGDGTFETTVNPTVSVTGTAAQDIDPPIVSVNEAVQNGISQITLSATDAGTGVKQIMYSVDGSTFQPYSAPFTVNPSQTSVVYAFADDNVANRSGVVTYALSSGPIRIDSVSGPVGRTAGGQQIKLTGAFANLSTVTMGGTAATWSYTNGAGDPSSITITTPPHAAGAVSIDLTPTSGAPFSKPNAFAYLPTVFTDDSIAAQVTTAKAQHIIELRQAVDALRAVAGLGGAPWSDSALAPNMPIKAIHIQELRTYLDDVMTRLGYSTSPYTDSGLTTGFTIKRVHLEEIRQRIRNIAG